MNENIKSTKFILTILVLILSFILVVLKMIEALDWFKWAIGLITVYTTGNTVSKLIKTDSAN